MVILGLDPGASGGVAWLNTESGQVNAVRMPDTEPDFVKLLVDIGALYDGARAFVEAVHAFPGQGACAVWNFAQNYGFIRGVLATVGVRREFVSPQKWQRALGISRPEKGKDPAKAKREKKIAMKQRAQELFPHLKVTLATADCLLLLEYGKIVVAQQSGAVPAKSES